MKLRLLSLFAVAALSWGPAPQVQAANITVKGGSCHALQFMPTPVPEPLHYSDGSVANPTGDSGYTVVCDVPRQPLAPTATSGK